MLIRACGCKQLADLSDNFKRKTIVHYLQVYWIPAKFARIEIFDFLEFYATYTDGWLPTFRDNLSVPSSRVKHCF